MKTWLISELFYPEEAGTGYFMTQIADKLAEDGEVNVICAPFNYETEAYKASYEISPNIKINRVKAIKLDKNKLVQRTMRMLLLTMKMGFRAFRKIKNGDKVILVTNPASILVFFGLLKKIRRFHYIIIVHDVFPENMKPLNMGMMKPDSFVYRISKKIFDYSYNAADHLIVVGKDMQQLVRTKLKKNIPVNVIQNWADNGNISPMENDTAAGYYQADFTGKVVIQFAGNIGRLQGLDLFFDLITKVKNDELVFVFLGDGAMKEKLALAKEEQGLDNVYFFEPKPRNEQQAFLNACHIALVSLSPGMFGLGVPSKTYNILSAGKPILFIGDQGSEVANYVLDADAGWAFSWNQENDIVNFLNGVRYIDLNSYKVKGMNGNSLMEEKFTKKAILEEYKHVITTSGSNTL